MANNNQCDKPSKLMLETQRLLKESRADIIDIYAATKIPYHWLLNFENDTGNPGVNRVEALYEYLSGKTLNV